MLDDIFYSVVMFSAISTAMMSGIYFTFSNFVMKAFEDIGAEKSVPAMNAINRVILRSWFMPLFFGSTLASAIIFLIVIMGWQQPSSTLLIIPSTIYFIGMFLCTIFFNVPLNNRLLAAEHASSTITNQTWSHYLKFWTRWNHLRTLSSLLASILYMYVLSAT